MTQTGRIKFFNKDKRYGFIINEEDEKEIFFHESQVEQGVLLEEDDKVTFETKNTNRGTQAMNVFLKED